MRAVLCRCRSDYEHEVTSAFDRDYRERLVASKAVVPEGLEPPRPCLSLRPGEREKNEREAVRVKLRFDPVWKQNEVMQAILDEMYPPSVFDN